MIPRIEMLRQKAEDTSALLPALMIKAERAAMNIFLGEHAQRKSGAGEKFWQFREYTPQDRPQDIDWRQSGKTDRVFIRQKERQLPQTALLWRCGAESMDFSSEKNLPTKSETANVITLALSILMTRAGERVGMLGETQTGRSEAALDHIGNHLIEKENKAPLPLHGPGRHQKNAALVLAGDFLSPVEECAASLKSLSTEAGGGFVIQILDPAEIELPFQGRAVFQDMGAQVRELVQNIPSIRDAYKKKIENHIASLREIAHDCSWHYVLHRTDEPVEETLLKVWMSLGAIQGRSS